MDDDARTELDVLVQAAAAAFAYRRDVAEADATPAASYGELLRTFAAATPDEGRSSPEVIAQLVHQASPGVRASTGPRFFGWVIGGSHPAGVAADWLVSAWGQNAGNLSAAPAASAIEAVAAGWLLDLLGLPPSASVGFVTGATVANFVCLGAARSEMLRRAGWDAEADGLFGAPPITVLIGADAHATVYSALKYLGLGARRVRLVAADDVGRIRPAAFERELRDARGPVIAIAQAGQINTGASDPFAELAPLCREHGAWLHVDGAFGLWAQAAPGRRAQTAGVEFADSWATDGHKWLQTPYDCGYAIVRDAEAHRRAMAISASYLPPAEGADRDASAYVPELSRRARGVATWAVIQRFGRNGIAEMIERCCRLAAHMAQRLAQAPGVTIPFDVALNQFVVRFGEGDDADRLTLATVARVQDEGVAFMGGAQWRGAWVMRVSVCSYATTLEDADISVEAVLRAWALVRRPGSADRMTGGR